VPEGADSVIRQEDTDLGADWVAVRSDRDVGVNLRFAGDDIRAGATVIAAGTRLGPAELGVLASLAIGHPVVHRRPRVAILASGDEIVDVDRPDEILSGRKIASSNSHSLVALVRVAGGEPVYLGIAADTASSVRAHLERAADCDLLITSAGISVGEHDHLRAVIAEMGGTLDFWRLRMRPGAPVGFGALGGIPWIGMPGNPVSTMVTFELFARPAIRRMTGHRDPFRRATAARAAEEILVGPKLQHFLRVILNDAQPPELRLTGPQGSGILSSMIKANALAVIPEGQLKTRAGAPVTVIRLDETRHQAEPPF
jgi:molybdopterin molybdotransferase